MNYRGRRAMAALVLVPGVFFGAQVGRAAIAGGLTDPVGSELTPVTFLDTSTSTTSTTVPCQEDDPCWDCTTMGNHTCGRVEVDLYRLTEGGDVWVQIYDERDNEVFTARVESVRDER